MSVLREAEKCLASQKTFAGLNAFITPLHRVQHWRDRARQAEARISHGAARSSLDGKLIAVKDNICTRELPTTCGSKILDSFTSPFDATVVEGLEDAGAIVAGKTNLDEFGMGSHSMHSYFGAVRNAAQTELEALSAGGSSGGSAIAVATGQCYAALGTDTGGSVRLPAAYTGIIGFKPSYGLLSRWGVVAYANSLDTVGVLAPNTTITKDVFNTLNRHDPRDPTSLSPSTRTRMNLATQFRKGEQGLRIGIPVEYNIQELSGAVREAWRQTLLHLHNQGHSLHTVSLPATKQALSAYYVLAPAEASSNLAKYDGVRYGTRPESCPDNSGGYLYARTRGAGFGDEVKRRILLGAFTLSADAIDNYFIQAQRVRRLVQHDFDAVFRSPNPLSDAALHIAPTNGGVDVLLVPTTPSLPPTLADVQDKRRSPLEAYMNDVFTVPASLAGLPAISVPVPVAEKESCTPGVATAGMQVIGQFGDDDLVLEVGAMLEGNVQ